MDDTVPSTVVEKDYRPMLYESDNGQGVKEADAGVESDPHQSPLHNDERPLSTEDSRQEFSMEGQATQSLDHIAADLKLSSSAKRQLFGRGKNHAGAIDVVNFNTDREYAANEMLRQAGDQAQHNPVRAIAPGKHSLKQLVNAASNQRDALEEHFASGRRNKKEAGSKYGW